MPAWEPDNSADLSDLARRHARTRFLFVEGGGTRARPRALFWPSSPLLFESNEQVDGIQAAFVLASALEGTQHNRHKITRQQNRESPRLTGGNLRRVFHNLLSLLQLLELIAKSQLPALSGVAQKNYMNILERVVQKGELPQSFYVKVTWKVCFGVLLCKGKLQHVQEPAAVHLLPLVLPHFHHRREKNRAFVRSIGEAAPPS